MKVNLLRQITSETFEIFDKNIKDLHSKGYISGKGLPLFNVWLSQTEWNRGCRIINIYSDNTVLFASKIINN